jgi:hypothetical protein
MEVDLYEGGPCGKKWGDDFRAVMGIHLGGDDFGLSRGESVVPATGWQYEALSSSPSTTRQHQNGRTPVFFCCSFLFFKVTIDSSYHQESK